MRSPYKKQKTFGQKVRGFFYKTTLSLAFAGAVATGWYEYYGSQEKIDAKIISVEDNNIILTTQGKFSNHPTPMYFKHEKETQDIAQQLNSGGYLSLTVYGITEKFNNKGLEDFGIYRNIVAAQAVYNDPADHENSCATNADMAEMAQKLPQVAYDLDMMRQLPMTGKCIYDMLQDPANGIISCPYPAVEGPGESGSYEDKQVRIEEDAGTGTTFHEYYHAAQDMKNRREHQISLTMGDYMFCSLLEEAIAAAYEITAQKEAENHGFSFTIKEESTVTRTETEIITTTITSASQRPENLEAFENAYQAALTAYENAAPEVREAKALEAGGQAVVRRLMKGEDTLWAESYSSQTVDNANNNSAILSGNKRDAALRQIAYANTGNILPNINLVPDEYVGPRAEEYIEECLKTFGLNVSSPAPSQMSRANMPPSSPKLG